MVRKTPRGRKKARVAAAAPSVTRYCAALDVVPNHSSRVLRVHKTRAALLNAAFWGAHARLTVSFLEGAPALHERVAQLARLWTSESGADVTFEFWINEPRTPSDADIRVAFDGSKGSWSYIGTFARQIANDKPTMNLGWMSLQLPEAEARSVVLHEFGHALGLIHEHLNPVQHIDWNRKRVREDLKRSQGWDDATIDANMFAQYDPKETFATDLDPQSIMMYPIPQGWTTNGFTAPFNTALTAKDGALIREAYGRQAVPGARK
jgi:serralysin